MIQDACAAPDLAFNGETIPACQVHGSFMAALGAVYAKIRATDDILKGANCDPTSRLKNLGNGSGSESE